MNHWLRALLASGLAASMLSGCAWRRVVRPNRDAAPASCRRPAPARSSTSSSSCKRIAASTISFRAIPAPTRSGKGKSLERPKREARSRCSLALSIRHRSLGLRDVRGVRRQPGDLPGTNCRMDGFDHEENFGGPRASSIPSTSTFRTASRSRTSTWRTSGCSPTACSSRSSTRASSRISTSSPRRRSRASTCPYGLWGCDGGKSDDVPTITTQRECTATSSSRASTITTLGDELDAAGLTWRFYTSKYGSPSSGDGSWWSGYQAVKHIYYGPDWKNDVITPQKQFLTDVAPASSPTSRGSRRSATTPITSTAAAATARRGSRRSSTPSARASSGTRPRSSCMWDDWGGLYDHVPPPYEDYDGLGFRVPLLVISPYAKKNYVSHVQYETASVLRFAEDLFGPAAAGRGRRARNSPAADCFDFTQAPRKFVKIEAPQVPELLHAAADGLPRTGLPMSARSRFAALSAVALLAGCFAGARAASPPVDGERRGVARALRDRRRQDPARRLHRAREPQLR